MIHSAQQDHRFPQPPPDGPLLNCWLAPGFDPIKMLRELVQQLNGRGGHVEQSYLYLDHMSAACWCAIADQEDYATAQRSMPIERAARAIAHSVGDAPIDVLGLGCGDAKHEVRLVQHLLEGSDPPLSMCGSICSTSASRCYRWPTSTPPRRWAVAERARLGGAGQLPPPASLHQLLHIPGARLAVAWSASSAGPWPTWITRCSSCATAWWASPAATCCSSTPA